MLFLSVILNIKRTVGSGGSDTHDSLEHESMMTFRMVSTSVAIRHQRTSWVSAYLSVVVLEWTRFGRSLLPQMMSRSVPWWCLPWREHVEVGRRLAGPLGGEVVVDVVAERRKWRRGGGRK